MERQVKFRAYQDDKMLHQPTYGNYALARFVGFLYEDAPLMQFTGMLDKNDKEIYECDIIRLCNNKKGSFEVIFVNGYQGGWNLKSKKHENTISLGTRNKSELEIIGNIYENPTILTDEAKRSF